MARAFHAGKARAFERGNVVVEIVDVLVIGSGISGLCSAALLAHRGYKTLVVPSHFEPTLAPEGKQLLQAELFVAREEYKKRPKQEWVRQLTDMVEDVFPGVKAEIEMIRSHVVSPSVHYQYGPYPKIPLECPGISNLYFCGDCTQAPGQGTERAASSAMIVAKTILQKEGKSAR